MSATHYVNVVQFGDFVCADLIDGCNFLNTFGKIAYHFDSDPFEIGDPDYIIPGLISEYSFLEIADYVKNYRKSRKISNNKPIVGIMNRAIEKNHFAHTNHDERFSVITINNIESLLSDISVFEYLSFEIAQHAVAVIYKAFSHREPRGCFFDFCGDKRDAMNIFRNGAFCSACKKAISDEARSYLTSIWTNLAEARKDENMPVDPNLLSLVLSAVSALSGLVSATESTVNLSKELRLQRVEDADIPADVPLNSGALKSLSELSDDTEEHEIILARIGDAQKNLTEALRNGSREEEAMALDVAGSEICRALSTFKRLNHGVLPEELYQLWTKFRC